MTQQMRSFDVDTAPVHRRHVQLRALTEQKIGDFGQKALQPWTFQDAATKGVDDRDRTAPQHFDEADHPESRIRP